MMNMEPEDEKVYLNSENEPVIRIKAPKTGD